MGYVAAEEAAAQLAAEGIRDHIVFATSSGGTQAGLVVGAEGGVRRAGAGDQRGPPRRDARGDVASVATLTAHSWARAPEPRGYPDRGWLYRRGYGVVDAERESIRLVASLEGLLWTRSTRARRWPG